MLEGLDKLNWQALEHAYGFATDVPGLIRDLASADERTRAIAIYELHGNIWHQGTVYEATAYAVPFLVELLKQESVQDKDQILGLLASIASGNPALQADDNFMRSMLEQKGRDFETELDLATFWADMAHDAVRDGIPVYLALLGDDHPKIRMGAAYVLSYLKERAADIAPHIRALSDPEKDTYVKASLIRSLGVLVESDPEYRQLFEDVVSSRDRELLRLVASLALTRVAREHTSPEAIALLTETCQRPELISDEYSTLPWLGDVVADACDALRNLGPSLAIPALIEALEKTMDEYDALEMTKTLLSLSFPVQQAGMVFGVWRAGDGLAERALRGKKLNGNTSFHELTEQQRLVLNAIVNSEILWQIGTDLFEMYGLPSSRQRLQDLLTT